MSRRPCFVTIPAFVPRGRATPFSHERSVKGFRKIPANDKKRFCGARIVAVRRRDAPWPPLDTSGSRDDRNDETPPLRIYTVFAWISTRGEF